MELLFSPYTLVKNNHQGVQKGALLKVIEGAHFGVADICPKIELGDATVLQQIAKNGSLFLRALELAHEDLNARKVNVSLLADKPVKNNLLITDYRNVTKVDFDKIENAVNSVGKISIKIKGDKDVKALSDFLNINFSKFSAQCSLRIDFNGKLTPAEFDLFLQSIADEVVKKIEYIEDPALVSAEWAVWNKQVPLACDFQKTENFDYFKYKIIKPAREVVGNSVHPFTLTSAMDHPVGVAHGLRFAQQLAQNDSGFLTLDLYEDCGFNKYYNQEELFLNFSKLALADFGIGMTEALNKLNWMTLDRMSL